MAETSIVLHRSHHGSIHSSNLETIFKAECPGENKGAVLPEAEPRGRTAPEIITRFGHPSDFRFRIVRGDASHQAKQDPCQQA